MDSNDKKAAIRRLLKERYFHTEKEAEKAREMLSEHLPKTMFSFRIDWEAKTPELKAGMILEIINLKSQSDGGNECGNACDAGCTGCADGTQLYESLQLAETT